MRADGKFMASVNSDIDLLKPIIYDSKVLKFDPSKRRNKSCRDYWLMRGKMKREAIALQKRKTGNKLLTDWLKKGG
jgi:hypothetical protein